MAKLGPGRKPKNGLKPLTRVRRIRLTEEQATVFDNAGPDAVRSIIDALAKLQRPA